MIEQRSISLAESDNFTGKKVLMASVLNPVLHPRIWYREAKHLAQIGFKVWVMGKNTEENIPQLKNIQGIGIKSEGRNILSRLKFQLHFIRQIKSIQPDIVHIHTPELGILALFTKFFMGHILIYDRHENYPEQLKDRHAYTLAERIILPCVAKFIEGLLFRYSDLIIHAEPGYFQQYSKKAILIRNSFIPLEVDKPSVYPEKYFLICGTLAERNGIREACHLWEQLYPLCTWPLVIAGYCTEPALEKFISAFQLKHKEKVILKGIHKPLPYSEIQELIRNTSCGLSLFRASAFLRGKSPSRFYEFMGYQKPLLICGNPEWHTWCAHYTCAKYIETDFPVAEIIAWIHSRESCTVSEKEYAWKYDAEVLREAYASLMEL